MTTWRAHELIPPGAALPAASSPVGAQPARRCGRRALRPRLHRPALRLRPRPRHLPRLLPCRRLEGTYGWIRSDSNTNTSSSAGPVPSFSRIASAFLFMYTQEPWLISMIFFHAILLLVTIISRRNAIFRLVLSALICYHSFPFYIPIARCIISTKRAHSPVLTCPCKCIII
jgi:hypothetical protein